MSALYTVSVFSTLLILAITAADVAENRLISKTVKSRAITVCILIAVCSLGEWLAQILEATSPERFWIQQIFRVLSFACVPAVGVIVAFSYGQSVRPKLAFYLVMAHGAFQLVSACLLWFLRADGEGMPLQQALYPVYIIACLLSMVYCGWSILRNNKQYQQGIDWVMVLTFLTVLLGFLLPILCADIRVRFLCAAICNLLFYIRYYIIVLQVDAVTGLQNRRCYDVTIAAIDTAACILLFDVDKFKQVNDTYGHSVGDLCLKNIGAILQRVYGKSGTCYRIGGDEFCVILPKNWDRVKEFNQQFQDAIQELRASDSRMPKVSVGYAMFYPIDRHIRNAIDAADEMLYRNKHGIS